MAGPRRRALLGGALALAAPALARAQAPIRVTDLLGRPVSLPRPPRRIVLGQGRLLGLMGLLHPDPASLLAGWASDMPIVLPDEYAAWRRRFPGLAQVPQLGRRILADLSLESVLQLQPDLVLLSRNSIEPIGRDGRSEVLERVAALGLTCAVIDCMDDPLRDTLPSIRILGALLGREAQADALAGFYAAHLAALDGWIAAQQPPVTRVMLHNHGGGRACCYSIGQGSFAALIARVGGRSIAAELLPTPLGQLNMETVLTDPWQVYVTTGGVYNGRGGVSLGAGIAPEEAARSLAAMLRAQRLDGPAAIRAGRAFGLWHGFNETPLHVVALEALIGWLHPVARPRFDPRATLDAFNSRFAAVPSEGTYWTGLPA
jgi:iron complex transport system substrate-binding protein